MIDYRLPEYRRKVFLDFYKFHSKYKGHPGFVYGLMPYFSEVFHLDQEQKFTVAYLNGIWQNMISTWLIFERFPTLKELNSPSFSKWFRENYEKLGIDTDRRYVKNQLEKCIENYVKVLDGKSQVDFFGDLSKSQNTYENFNKVWDKVITDFYLFGRLATFSYTEYLRIMGLNIECYSLFLDDISGSRSHRNGLCKVMGWDSLIYDDKLNPGFEGKYTTEQIEMMAEAGDELLQASFDSAVEDPSFFTLESTFCCYKSWHKKNRRYPNCYNDMFHDRIKFSEARWDGKVDLSHFWKARKVYLPDYLRLEDNPNDPGLVPEKQNWYRETGQVIMMSKDFPEYDNPFDRKIWSKGLESFYD